MDKVNNTAGAPGGYALAKIVTSVFAVYLSIGISLGILPELITGSLGFGSMLLGIIMGLQAFATLLTRAYSGKRTDTKGAASSKRAGVLLVFISGTLYSAAGMAISQPFIACIILGVARIVHGVSESLVVTGALTWGIGIMGQQRSGKVMTWNGIAMFAGIALGAPLGLAALESLGIAGAFSIIILLSAVSWFATAGLPVLKIEAGHVRTPFYKVVGKVSGEGMALAFSSIGFACIASFISLVFAENNWGNSSAAFLLFGGFYILTRVFFASFPDKYGGYKVAIASFLIEVAGQLLIGISSGRWMAMAGCALTGMGFSLIFPSLGVLAIKKVSPGMRGTALSAYSAFFDLSLGIAAPLAGIVAGWFDYKAIYLFGSLGALVSIVILLINKSNSVQPGPDPVDRA